MAMDISQLPKHMVKDHKRIINRIEMGLASAARRGRTHMVPRTPTDQGQLRNSWRVDGQLLRNTAPHAGIVELGARPHPVSKEGFLALVEWAKRHGLGGARRQFQRGGRTRIQGPQQAFFAYGEWFVDADAPAAKVALGIVRKIRHHGQAPTYFVRDELPALTKIAKTEVERKLRKARRAKK